MAGVGFSGGKSGRNPEKPNSGICQKSKNRRCPLPDDPDIEGTGCLSLQIRVGVFVGGGLADVPESGEVAGENRRFSSRALLSFRRHIQTPSWLSDRLCLLA